MEFDDGMVAAESRYGRGPASIAILDSAQPDQPLRVIYENPNGSVWQASLSYDASTVFFAASRQGVLGGWHLYEIGVDGKNLKQITADDGNDIAPVELPNGQLAFVSNRAGNMNVCQANRAGAIYPSRLRGSVPAESDRQDGIPGGDVRQAGAAFCRGRRVTVARNSQNLGPA